jgi:hypothetical protein
MPRKVGTPWKIELSGKVFNEWTVLNRIAGSLWLCKCSCGDEYAVAGNSLTLGKSKKCKKCTSKTHGLEGSKIYMAWAQMKKRCLCKTSKEYKNYGERGIKVCDSWLKFENFLADMGTPQQGFSLDRINNNGNYEPFNCRWATQKQQNRNTRKTLYIEYEGKMQCLADLAEKYGHKPITVRNRLKFGWGIDDALKKPNRKAK